jgi:hypothetical protein
MRERPASGDIVMMSLMEFYKDVSDPDLKVKAPLFLKYLLKKIKQKATNRRFS